MLAASARLAFVGRRRRWLGRRLGSGYVSGLGLRRGSRLSGRLLGGCSGGRSPLCGSFPKRCSGPAALFSVGSSTGGGGGGLLFGFVLLGCLSRVLVVRMIPLDRLFVPLRRFLRP